MDKLKQAVNQVTTFIPQHEITNADISQASVGWHIAHSCLVINSIVGALKQSNPADYTWKFSVPYLYVTITGFIPRGRGKAPGRVVPRQEINKETLQQLSAQAKNSLAELPNLARNSFFKHPYFGVLRKNAAIRFLKIHTWHHYKIIRDILG